MRRSDNLGPLPTLRTACSWLLAFGFDLGEGVELRATLETAIPLTTRFAFNHLGHPFPIWSLLKNSRHRVELVSKSVRKSKGRMKGLLLQVARPTSYCNLIGIDKLDWLVFRW